jgi:hypothetical protein
MRGLADSPLARIGGSSLADRSSVGLMVVLILLSPIFFEIVSKLAQ